MEALALSNVAREIYEYLRLHPGAKDSAEGIARWWVEADVPQVRDALEELAEKELIAKSEGERRELYYAVEQGEDEPSVVPILPTPEQDFEPASRGLIRPAKNLLDLTEENWGRYIALYMRGRPKIHDGILDISPGRNLDRRYRNLGTYRRYLV